MAESRPYENKAHRAAKLIVPRWPGWKHLREKLQYAAYYDNPKSNNTWVFAYAHSPMRPTGWMELFQFKNYKKIEGLFETEEQYQKMKKQGKLTEYGTAPSLRGPRPSCVKVKKNDEDADEDLEGLSERELKKRRLTREYEENMRLLEMELAAAEAEADEAEVDPMEAVLAGAEADEAAKPLKPEINYRNLEELALRFHKEHAVASDQLKDTLAAMHKAGWRFCNAVEERGLPGRYYAQFTAAVHGGTIYTPEYFEQMRVDQLVETRGRPRKRARAVEASPCEAEAAKPEEPAAAPAAPPEEHEHREDKENKERRAQASAAAAARAMLAVRAAWGGKC
jgi:hypothetical protein